MPDARALGFTQLHPAQPSVLMSANVNGAIGKAAAPATSQQAGSEASKEAAGAQMPAASGAGSGKKRKQQQAVQHPSAKKQKTAPVTLQQLSPNKHIATAGTKGKQAVVPILATSALQQRLPSGSKAASNAGNTPSVAQARQAASINATQAKHEQQGQKLAPIAGSLSSKHAQHVTARRLSQQSHDLRTHNKVVAAADRPTASARRSRLSVQGLPNTQQPASHPKTASSRAKPSSAAASKPSTAGKVMSLVAASAKHPEASKVASVPAQSTPTQSNPALSTRGKSLPAQSAKPSTVSKAEPNPVKAGKPLSAARIKTSKVGAAASAAGQAAAEALESKLGCSKCRYVPSGCIRCRAKQAGQLTAGKPSAKRR